MGTKENQELRYRWDAGDPAAFGDALGTVEMVDYSELVADVRFWLSGELKRVRLDQLRKP